MPTFSGALVMIFCLAATQEDLVFLQITAMITTIGYEAFKGTEGQALLENCLAHLAESLHDPSYAARRHAALTVPHLYADLSLKYEVGACSASRAGALAIAALDTLV